MLRRQRPAHAGESLPRRRAWRRASRWLTTVLFAGAVLLFWPTSLGGCSTLTIVAGHSMEPTYYTGDLVWARCGVAQIGDIVVYEPEGTDGARVIHRIVDGTPEGWTMQGDNNPLVDPWTPDETDVIGVARLHIPWVGKMILAMGNPLIWVSMLVLAAALLVWPQSRTTSREHHDADAQPGEESAADIVEMAAQDAR